MRVAIVGAGPAGLYFAYLLKRGMPDAEIAMVEQNPADATFGFGVVFSDRALEFLRDDDPQTYSDITPHMQSWDNLALVHRGECIEIDGVGFAAIGRLQLLQLLQGRAASLGVAPRYGHVLSSLDELGEVDLIVGADGVNSLVRQARAEQFGASHEPMNNRFVWFGTTKPFDTLTQSFRVGPHGPMNAHHYRYAPAMSTFIVETTAEVWERAGFADMSTAETMAYCEQVFADDLDGHNLISNKSEWRRFPKIWNEHWSAGNAVLIGDALRTAHFSIGSGTRLAMEDAIALARAVLASPRDLATALAAYEAARRPVVEKLVAAANQSAEWYEAFDRHMELAPADLAYSYIRRAGRLNEARLHQLAPRFMASYRTAQEDVR
jgi:2-polyprenyl-6-methoxyphenol hydroxylase-like FAD-dependent oxidoreductase